MKIVELMLIPGFTEYQGINLTAPSFIIIDLDLKDFESQEMLDKILRKTLNKINKIFHGAQPTVLWTGGGYHIYQPIRGFVLEEIDRFACFIDPNKKDLTSRFMQFAEDYFTDKKSDSQHRPSSQIMSYSNTRHNQLEIQPRSANCTEDGMGIRPPIQCLLRDFRTWLVAEKINDKREKKNVWKHRNFKNFGYSRTDTIPWIGKLLQTPIADHRKYAIWRILMPYLFNIKKLSDPEVISIVQTWLDSCAAVRPLDFNSKYLIRQNIKNSKHTHRYLPIGFSKLSSENQELFNIISEKWNQ